MDPTIITQTSWDSGILNGLTTIVHKFDAEGDHQVTLVKGGKPVKSFPIQVRGKGVPASGKGRGRKKPQAFSEPAAQVERAAIPEQIDIDLPGLEKPEKEHGQGKKIDRFSASLEDHVLFQAPGDPEGYSIVSQVGDKGKEKETFNSQKLTANDFYTVTLVRPARYTMANLVTGAKGTITMTYPVVGDKPYDPPEPARVRCTAKGFEPAEITLQPFQTLVFEFRTPSRIKIDLVEPIGKPERQK
jgi:hypothetical protein